MKLEIGMYCYNKTNRKLGIGKIIDFQCNNNVKISYKNDFGFSSTGNVIASFNIIDILEVGDYVNGYKVEKVNNNLSEHKGICNSLDTYLWGINDLDEFEKIVIFENDIKSVITHEQMEQITYKVGE